MPPTETTKEGARSMSLRLSLMHPDGRQVDYDQPLKNSQESYDSARQLLSDREREKVAAGWDSLGRYILETVDEGTDIKTRMLVGKTWEFVGPPAVPPAKTVLPTQPSIIASNGVVQVPGVPQRVPPPTENPSEEVFLEALGELCLKHRFVVAGDNLRLEAFTLKGLRKVLALGE